MNFVHPVSPELRLTEGDLYVAYHQRTIYANGQFWRCPVRGRWVPIPDPSIASELLTTLQSHPGNGLAATAAAAPAQPPAPQPLQKNPPTPSHVNFHDHSQHPSHPSPKRATFIEKQSPFPRFHIRHHPSPSVTIHHTTFMSAPSPFNL